MGHPKVPNYSSSRFNRDPCNFVNVGCPSLGRSWPMSSHTTSQVFCRAFASCSIFVRWIGAVWKLWVPGSLRTGISSDPLRLVSGGYQRVVFPTNAPPPGIVWKRAGRGHVRITRPRHDTQRRSGYVDNGEDGQSIESSYWIRRGQPGRYDGVQRTRSMRSFAFDR